MHSLPIPGNGKSNSCTLILGTYCRTNAACISIVLWGFSYGASLWPDTYPLRTVVLATAGASAATYKARSPARLVFYQRTSYRVLF